MPNELIVDKIAELVRRLHDRLLDTWEEMPDTDSISGLGELTFGDIREAAAVLEVLRPMMWQPIESAPKDGNEFLAYGDEIGWQVVDYDPTEEGSDWVWKVSDGATYHKDAFTHWAHLDPPTLQTGESEL